MWPVEYFLAMAEVDALADELAAQEAERAAEQLLNPPSDQVDEQ
jgi:hypothetical protein